MRFETTDDPSAQDGSAGPTTATTTPYERKRQARADVAGVYAQCTRSNQRGVLGEANLACLREACDQASVTLVAFDTRILAWLAGWEPETCAVVAGLITRAYAAELSPADSAGPLSEQRGQHQRRPR
jgi:hypothetical protein